MRQIQKETDEIVTFSVTKKQRRMFVYVLLALGMVDIIATAVVLLQTQ